MISATHAASASAEVVVSPKICLYWNRDGLRMWPIYVLAELLPALPGLKFLRWGVAIWVAW